MLALLIATFTLTLPEPDAFVDYHEEDQIKVRILRTETHPWVRGEGIVEAPPERVAAILKQFGNYKDVFKGMIKTSQILEEQADMARVHLVWPFPWYLKDRDAVVAYHFRDKGKGAYQLQWKGTEKPGDPSDGVRVKDVAGRTEWEPGSEPGTTRMVYLYLGDLGGDFGEDNNEKAWKKEPIKYFQAVRRAVSK